MVIAIGVIAFCCFFNWVLIIKPHNTSLKQDEVQIWIPIISACVAIIVWIRPGLKKLNIFRESGNLPLLFMFVAIGTVAAPAILIQEYLLTATGKMTRLYSINDISKYPSTKYYTLKHYFINKAAAQIYYDYSVGGRNKENLDVEVYITCPITYIDKGSTNEVSKLNSPETTALKSHVKNITGLQGSLLKEPPPAFVAPLAWACFYYGENVSNQRTEEERQNIMDAFYRKAMIDFDYTRLGLFTYLDRIGYTDHTDGYKTAISKINDTIDTQKLILLEPKFTPFTARNGDKLSWTFGSFAIFSFVWFIIILAHDLKEDTPAV